MINQSHFVSVAPSAWTSSSLQSTRLVLTERSWNLGLNTGDDPQAVIDRRNMLASQLGVQIPWLTQVHGTDVVTFSNRVDHLPTAIEADACLSNQTGIACAVLTADCCPILLATDDGQCWGAIHAGWRGLAAGIITTTLQSLYSTFDYTPDRVQFWIGPTIRGDHYEVDDQVRQAFFDQAPTAWHLNMTKAFLPSRTRPDDPLHYQCDLVALVTLQAQHLGVRQISDAGLDSFSSQFDHSEGGQKADWRFYSHRRYSKGLEPPSEKPGRMASLIVGHQNRQ